jgi:hypothetical protein
MAADQGPAREPSSDTPESTDRERTTHRRRVLEVIAAGGGVLATSTLLPETWVKPVVDAIVVPAHAQGSPPAIVCSTFLCTVTGFALGGAGSVSSTSRQTTSSGAFSNSTAVLSFTSTLPSISYSDTLNRSGEFTAAGCSGTDVVVSTITVASGTADRMMLFTQRDSTTQSSGTNFRVTVRDLGIFVFTSTCAGVP